jgi:hypothetical protein
MLTAAGYLLQVKMCGPLLTAFTIRDSAFISDQSREPVVANATRPTNLFGKRGQTVGRSGRQGRMAGPCLAVLTHIRAFSVLTFPSLLQQSGQPPTGRTATSPARVPRSFPKLLRPFPATAPDPTSPRASIPGDSGVCGPRERMTRPRHESKIAQIGI